MIINWSYLQLCFKWSDYVNILFPFTECFGSNITSSNSEPKSSSRKVDNCYKFDDNDNEESSRLLDWMIPSWSYEQSQMEHHMYFCTILNQCSCNNSSFSQDENINSAWDDTSSSSIWEH